MPEKMADSRFQAVPMNLNAAAPQADMPDLSHLTEEERRIIESVMMRQRQEEERENEIMRYVPTNHNFIKILPLLLFSPDNF
jgi:hypothetical protein